MHVAARRFGGEAMNEIEDFSMWPCIYCGELTDEADSDDNACHDQCRIDHVADLIDAAHDRRRERCTGSN